MKILVLILGIVVCCVTCTSKRLNRQVVVNNDQVFFDDWDASRSALDLALHRSRVEKKPLLLWMSAYGYSFDPILIKKINDIPWLKNYILDSMVDCRLMVDSKFKYRPIKSREMKALVPREMNFRYECSLKEIIFSAVSHVKEAAKQGGHPLHPVLFVSHLRPSCSAYLVSSTYHLVLPSFK